MSSKNHTQQLIAEWNLAFTTKSIVKIVVPKREILVHLKFEKNEEGMVSGVQNQFVSIPLSLYSNNPTTLIPDTQQYQGKPCTYTIQNLVVNLKEFSFASNVVVSIEIWVEPTDGTGTSMNIVTSNGANFNADDYRSFNDEWYLSESSGSVHPYYTTSTTRNATYINVQFGTSVTIASLPTPQTCWIVTGNNKDTLILSSSATNEAFPFISTFPQQSTFSTSETLWKEILWKYSVPYLLTARFSASHTDSSFVYPSNATLKVSYDCEVTIQDV